MDSFEFNKIAGAVLGALLFLMGIGIFSDAIFHRAPPKTAAYNLPAEEAAPAAAAAAGPSVPLPELLAKADAKRGETLSKPCAACHTFEKGGADKIGPHLYGVVARPIASASGFAYSDALKGKGGEWSYAALDQFIANPRGYANGTKMAYGGEKDPARRADILAYLRSKADTPAPLPAP
ncbi:MAG: cytochrome c family protein [Beijerinckiaceae bacterium]|jgi:cytochrome c|nr:cytochrome c family protein [Beijerinckiaceae bacterium]MDO9440430.1 cytochrome c family protein [Beijerinckiaceae bacterium]